MIPFKVTVRGPGPNGGARVMTITQWFHGEAEWFRANFLASEHPGPFAWTYFMRCAVRVLEIIR